MESLPGQEKAASGTQCCTVVQCLSGHSLTLMISHHPLSPSAPSHPHLPIIMKWTNPLFHLSNRLRSMWMTSASGWGGAPSSPPCPLHTGRISALQQTAAGQISHHTILIVKAPAARGTRQDGYNVRHVPCATLPGFTASCFKCASHLDWHINGHVHTTQFRAVVPASNVKPK